jgi:TPR repeat protein
MAAQQGNADAQDALGDMYFDGDGVPQDDAEAVHWYNKAAAQGNADAQSSLGLVYEFSESVPHDLKEAAKWYRLAADQGDASGQLHLAKLYEDGRGVSQNLGEACKLFSKVAANSHLSYKEREETIKELYSLRAKFSPKFVFDPPLPPEPFGLQFSRGWDWVQSVVGQLIIGGFIVLLIWVIGRFILDKAKTLQNIPIIRRLKLPIYYFFLTLVVSMLFIVQASTLQKGLFLLEISVAYWLSYFAISSARGVLYKVIDQARQLVFKLRSMTDYSEATQSTGDKQEIGKFRPAWQQKEGNEMWYANERQKVVLILLAVILIAMVAFPPFHIVVRGSQFSQGFGFILSPPSSSASVDTSLLLLEIIVATIVCTIVLVISRR